MNVPDLGGIPITYTHVCYVTADLEQSIATFAALGAKVVERVEFSIGIYAMAQVPDGTTGVDGASSWIMVELLMPTEEGNLYSDHLAKYGPGLHHLGVTVSDFDACLDALIAAGCVPMTEHRAPNYDMCYLDCGAIGFPIIQMVAS
ncbi:VOC family protein [Pseudofrankia sp. BMG5.37]|uniref:VOC family protein n=1 Tax=Pseudofrankia sp. BMG5.37 TaxID=3050035 RepID=UPI002894D141|nr:VOC family protein [Pseudofrankia sp. BMG5.37]MDT3439270.1 VOC family protein [Pseudofrankia sp. BMG5.37]